MGAAIGLDWGGGGGAGRGRRRLAAHRETYSVPYTRTTTTQRPPDREEGREGILAHCTTSREIVVYNREWVEIGQK